MRFPEYFCEQNMPFRDNRDNGLFPQVQKFEERLSSPPCDGILLFERETRNI
jgi:hypothetical protein